MGNFSILFNILIISILYQSYISYYYFTIIMFPTYDSYKRYGVTVLRCYGWGEKRKRAGVGDLSCVFKKQLSMLCNKKKLLYICSYVSQFDLIRNIKNIIYERQDKFIHLATLSASHLFPGLHPDYRCKRSIPMFFIWGKHYEWVFVLRSSGG